MNYGTKEDTENNLLGRERERERVKREAGCDGETIKRQKERSE